MHLGLFIHLPLDPGCLGSPHEDRKELTLVFYSMLQNFGGSKNVKLSSIQSFIPLAGVY